LGKKKKKTVRKGFIFNFCLSPDSDIQGLYKTQTGTAIFLQHWYCVLRSMGHSLLHISSPHFFSFYFEKWESEIKKNIVHQAMEEGNCYDTPSLLTFLACWS